MVIQCKNLISLYILPDQRRVNLLVFNKSVTFISQFITTYPLVKYTVANKMLSFFESLRFPK